MLRSLFSGIYTVDNMDFVLRDAYMSGYNTRAFDLERLLHYSFFTPQGLTIHSRGLAALVRFMSVRAELFRTIYFHRTVRAIDLTLADLFADSKRVPVPRQSARALDAVSAVHRVVAAGRRGALARRATIRASASWACAGRRCLNRQIPWKMACQRNLVFDAAEAERSSIFSRADFVERELRGAACRRNWPTCRCGSTWPGTSTGPTRAGPSTGQNFLWDPARGEPRPLTDDQLFRQLPLAHRICRVYVAGSGTRRAAGRGARRARSAPAAATI